MKCITFIDDIGHSSSLEIEITFDASPGEPEILRDGHGEGCPGERESAELIDVQATTWMVDEDIRCRDDSSVWKSLDSLAFRMVDEQWDDRYESICLDEAYPEGTK